MRIDTHFEPILTDRLRLRRSRPEDAETISAYRADPAVHRYQGWERTDPDGVRAEIEEMAPARSRCAGRMDAALGRGSRHRRARRATSG